MQRRQQKTANTANYSDKPAPNQFAPRSFVVQTQADAATKQQQETSDLQVEEVSEKQFGNGLPDASLFTRQFASPPIPRLQMKLSFGESQTIQRHEEEDEVQMKPDVQRHQEEDEVQMKPDVQRHQEEDEAIQRQAENNGSFDAGINLESRIRGNQSGGQPLDTGVRAFMEPRFGHSFAGVRVHTNSESVQMNQELHAQAFTNGQHIYFNEGKYNPGSESGKQLLAHELTHTIQQTGGNELQRQSDSNCGAACQCSNCVPVNPLIQRQISVMRSPDTQNLLNRKLTDVVQAHGMSCPCHSCSTPSVKIQRQTEAKHGSGCSCSMCAGKKGIQTKLTVGAPGDRYEQEADKIAAQVVRMPEHQPTEPIQRHEEEELAQTKPLATAITPVVVQRHDQEKELAQTKAEFSTITPTIEPTTISGIIQRHASWEHKMLGDVTPDALEIMGAGRNNYNDLGSAVDEQGRAIRINEGAYQGKFITKDMVLHTIEQEIRRLEYFRTKPPIAATQEEATKLAYQDADDRSQQVFEKTGNMGAALDEYQDDKAWQVRLVEIPLQNGQSEVVTYGEMNTLADIYGSVAELQQADPANLHGIIQGIRQESLFKFMKLYEEISGTTKYKDLAAEKLKQQPKEKGIHMGRGTWRTLTDYDKSYNGLEFEGAIGNTGKGDKYGELSFMGKIPDEKGKEQLPDKPETSYLSGLARNACHFAPESWIAWKDYHDQAIKLAKTAFDDKQEAATLRVRAEQIEDPIVKESYLTKAGELEASSAKLANEAYLNNGFGDHYLQDSYAAGHLINKTQIMQWYVQFIDKTNEWDYHYDQNWRQAQDMAYSQPGLSNSGQYDKNAIVSGNVQAKNPQHVADMSGDWKDKHDALGLKVPSSLTPNSPSYSLITWWQTQLLEPKFFKSRTKTIQDLLDEGPIKDQKTLYTALSQLFYDGVVRLDKYDTAQRGKDEIKAPLNTKVVIRDAFVPTDKQKFDEALQDPQKYQDMVKAVNYQEYQEFMRSSFIQKSTNALHDYFCKEGLDVYSGDSNRVFKVYGDNAMLQKGSSQGVKHSAQTSRMSVESIDDIITNGATNKTTANIFQRFPEGVKLSNGALLSLSDWHNQGTLKKFCDDQIFPGMSWEREQKLLPGIAGKDLGAIFGKEEQPHGSEAF